MSSLAHDIGRFLEIKKTNIRSELKISSTEILNYNALCHIPLQSLWYSAQIFSNSIPQKSGISFIYCFSAGIFLGMALIIVISEGVEMYAYWSYAKKIEKPFLLDYALIFVDYLIVLGSDRVMKIWLLKLHDYHQHHNHNHW